MGKIHYKIVKFEIENFEQLCLELIKNEMGPHLSCNLHKIGTNIYSKLAVALFLCKKVWSWVGGQMVGRAGLRIAYNNQKLLEE